MGSDPTQGVRSELAGESDADLLVYMTMARDDPVAAREAWDEFYRRHVEYLYGVCLRAYGRLLGGPAGVSDLVADTFKRAYEHAARFEDAGITDREKLRLRARGWLGRIAERLALTILRGRSRLPTQRLDLDQWQRVPERPPAPGRDPRRIEQVRAAIEALSEREQIVIRVTFQWYQPDREHQRLPNEVAADLAASLGTTPENLRQIRRRALRKIQAWLEQHTDDT